MKIKLNLKPDEPSVNGRIYPKDIIEREIISKEVPVYLGIGTGELNILDDLVGFAKSEINEKNEIVCEIKLLSSNAAKIFSTMPPSGYDYTIKGIGEVTDNIVSDFKCSSINVIDKEGE